MLASSTALVRSASASAARGERLEVTLTVGCREDPATANLSRPASTSSHSPHLPSLSSPASLPSSSAIDLEDVSVSLYPILARTFRPAAASALALAGCRALFAWA